MSGITKDHLWGLNRSNSLLQTVRRWISSGKLEARKEGRKLIISAELDDDTSHLNQVQQLQHQIQQLQQQLQQKDLQLQASMQLQSQLQEIISTITRQEQQLDEIKKLNQRGLLSRILPAKKTAQ